MTPNPDRFLVDGKVCHGYFVFKFADGLCGRGAQNSIPYLYRKALILALELIRPYGTTGAYSRLLISTKTQTGEAEIGSLAVTT